MRSLAALAIVAGCGFAPSVAKDGGTTGDATDGRVDTKLVDTPPGVPCFGSDPLDTVCSTSFMSGDKVFTSNTSIDTDTSTQCLHTTANGVAVCVIAFGSITIAENVTLRAHGSQPLILVATSATGSITLGGPHAVLDVGAHRTGASTGPGAGAFAGADCAANATAATGFGGGYGGSFTQTGGGGGEDNQNQGAGGPANAQSVPTRLHGGCAGSPGGNNTGAAFAGGAVALIAPSITITGFISASGAGGGDAPMIMGGDGGGAAGAIVLDALAINGIGNVLAQGGGGGEGSAGNTGNPGSDGFIDAINRLNEMQGGANGSSAGDGGDGGGTTNARGGMTAPQTGSGQGGGGGGGAAGITLVFRGTPAGTLTFSPPAT